MQFCMKLTVLQRSPPEMEIYYNERYLTALGAAPRCKKSLVVLSRLIGPILFSALHFAGNLIRVAIIITATTPHIVQ